MTRSVTMARRGIVRSGFELDGVFMMMRMLMMKMLIKLMRAGRLINMLMLMRMLLMMMMLNAHDHAGDDEGDNVSNVGRWDFHARWEVEWGRCL